MPYQYRSLAPKLAQHAEDFSIVGLKGPFGSGKTTLLVNQFPKHGYINFDDPRTLLRYREDPQRFLRQTGEYTIFDEIQHAPELINTIIEQDNPDSHTILASSCLFNHIKQVNTEQLSKIKMLTLLPLQYTEIPNQHREESIFRGGFPQLVSQHYSHYDQWFTKYIQQQLTHQLPNIGSVSSTHDLQRLLHLLASQTAQPLNMSIYAHQLGLDVKTIKRWIQLLVANFIVLLVPAYPDNFGKRTIKSPKLYFYDTGLVSYLTGIETRKQYEFGPLSQAIYENYVVMEILKKTLYASHPTQLYHYRTNHGVSLDLIIEQNQQRHLICLHNNETFRLRMIKPLETFKQENDQCYLLYNGDDLSYRDNIYINNVSTYLHSR